MKSVNVQSALRGTLRALVVGVGLFVALNAGPGCGPTQPEQGSVTFVGQCSRAGTIQLFIDGAAVGSMGGGSSATFPVSPGSHSLSARGGAFVWNPRTVTVRAGETLTYDLLC